MKLFFHFLLLASMLFLVACTTNSFSAPFEQNGSNSRPTSITGSDSSTNSVRLPSSNTPTEPLSSQDEAVQPTQADETITIQLAELIDKQGSVTVVVEALDLVAEQETINFEVSLDTHSVDLSMDLASLARLTTDTGQNVQAIAWDAQRGGHHVSGILKFPAIIDGKPVLDGSSRLTLTISNVDAPERVFAWDLK
jgi:hypothetical protein